MRDGGQGHAAIANRRAREPDDNAHVRRAVDVGPHTVATRRLQLSAAALSGTTVATALAAIEIKQLVPTSAQLLLRHDVRNEDTSSRWGERHRRLV